MKLEVNSSNRVLVAVLVVVACWPLPSGCLLLSPKRDEAKKLDTKVENAGSLLAQHQAEANAAARSRAKSSRPTTSSWSCSARPCPATTTPPRCWSSSTGSPTAPEVEVRDLRL